LRVTTVLLLAVWSPGMAVVNVIVVLLGCRQDALLIDGPASDACYLSRRIQTLNATRNRSAEAERGRTTPSRVRPPLSVNYYS